MVGWIIAIVGIIALAAFGCGLYLFMKGSGAKRQPGIAPPPSRRSIAEVAADLAPKPQANPADDPGDEEPADPEEQEPEEPAATPAQAALTDLLKQAFAIVFATGDEAKKYTDAQRQQAQGLLLMTLGMVFLLAALATTAVAALAGGGSDGGSGPASTTSTTAAP